MDNALLVKLPLAEGKKLIDALEMSGLPLKAAMWLHFDEADVWRLMLASPLVDDEGPRRVYERIQKVLIARKDILDIRLSDITVLGPDEDIVKPLRIAYDKRAETEGIIVKNGVITGGNRSVNLDETDIYFARV